MSQPRIVLAGGGTGGHVAPAIALAEEWALRYGRNSVLFLCSGNDLERKMIGHAGFNFAAAPVARPKGSITSKLNSLASCARAVPKAAKIIRDFGAIGVVGAGGYASLPGVAAAGSIRRLPVALLEANVVPGRVTRLASRFAKVCYAHLPLSRKIACRVAVRGNPVRQAFRLPISRQEARCALRIDQFKRTLLVFGASQGASGINRAVLEAIPLLKLERDRLQVLHITGAADVDKARAMWRESGIAHRCAAFTHLMPLWMSAADVAISRSSASSISELAATGVGMLLVPLPSSADGHQAANAELVQSRGAGVYVPQASLDGEELATLLDRYLFDEASCARLAAGSRAVAKPEAAVEIVDALEAEFGISKGRDFAEKGKRAA